MFCVIIGGDIRTLVFGVIYNIITSSDADVDSDLLSSDKILIIFYLYNLRLGK